MIKTKCNKQQTCFENWLVKAKKIHGDKYDYKFVKYINNKINVDIYCNTCKKIFSQPPCHHIKKHRPTGCSKCAKEKCIKIAKENNERKSNAAAKIFVNKAKKIHGDKYDYKFVKYKTARIEIDIYCNTCKEIFSQPPHHHINKNKPTGCSNCKASKGENAIKNFLESKKIEYTKEFFCCKDRPDFVIPKFRMIIEFNGIQHYVPISFGSKEKNAAKDNLKENIKRDYYKIQRSINNHNIPLLIIPYWEINRIHEILDWFLCSDAEKLKNGMFNFSNPPEEVVKYTELRKELRKELGIQEDEILCGFITDEFLLVNNLFYKFAS